ncbi:MAG: transposase [Sandaracinus sp.]
MALRDERGVGSAKHLERLCQRDLPYRWICGGMTPNAHSLSDFRAMHGDKLDTLMTQLLASLMHKGLVKLRRVTQDGMRLRAHAGTGKFHRKPKLDEQLEEARAQIATLKAELESDTSASLDREQAAKMRAAAERQRKIEAALNEMPKVARTHERTRAQRARNAARRASRSTTTGHESARPTPKLA